MYEASSRNKCQPAGLEYGLLVVLFAIIGIAMLTPLGETVSSLYEVVTAMIGEVGVS